jgi:hypothetical protein
MYLSRRSNGVYYLWYEDDFGCKHKVSTRTTLKSEAIQFLREFKVSHVRTNKSKRLNEFVTEFLAFAETTYSPKTVDIYRRVFGIFQKQTGNLTLQNITPRDIDQYNVEGQHIPQGGQKDSPVPLQNVIRVHNGESKPLSLPCYMHHSTAHRGLFPWVMSPA